MGIGAQHQPVLNKSPCFKLCQTGYSHKILLHVKLISPWLWHIKLKLLKYIILVCIILAHKR